jgi:hypothetical protein
MGFEPTTPTLARLWAPETWHNSNSRQPLVHGQKLAHVITLLSDVSGGFCYHHVITQGFHGAQNTYRQWRYGT